MESDTSVAVRAGLSTAPRSYWPFELTGVVSNAV